ncbi:YhcN/YlaJ family sporulation lipoprotein [Bacillus vallismortis]|uniref:YhcN/YlaJ family sporulation lipoprotein n=1 Tax=Bacillus vallismortis TaxID=72361 RepID=A0AAP3FU55_BACVA|nr:YhcN/YlaJ family sporulation lipoprotein [Bacillus vallismortis]MCY7918456.1 YhcN/YlaJ family sporulation lipoprotein [Bacillus vallismortis]MCY8315620.1 YhcN/YlaJ family sporulation lipoprotein [Bacillus vallismortis]MCY8425093.1 YhcN/YlaJ family sporulation lipoprotein [Bacillus vallismortis]MCY8532459.1 YhcN/YlaJ family sporulation lipoprotein [Bacillus vallismortis]MCY8548084.1 YhcN/YlaJ family sporulation lipoprotein [Bacillus vallismortis]
MLGKKQALASLLLIPLLMTGCGMANQGEGRRDQANPENVNYRNPVNDNGRGNINDVNNNRDNVDNNVTDNVNDNGNNNGNDNRQLEVADDAADKISDMKEVERANVIVAGNQAYVAVVLKNGKEEVGQDLKKKISEKVKDTDKNMDNVYVSANPDFVDRMQGYGERIQNGDPVAGFFDEFSETVQRIFPQPE